MSIAIGAAARIARQGMLPPASLESTSVSRQILVPAPSFLIMRRNTVCSAGGKTFMAGSATAGLAPANVLRAAFRPRDDEILAEKENEIEGGEERRWGGSNVRARAVLPWGKRGRSLWRGIGATPFFLGQPPDRPADSFEGAQLLGGELAGGRRGVAGHLPWLERHRLFVRRLGDSLLLAGRARGQWTRPPVVGGQPLPRTISPLCPPASSRTSKEQEIAGWRPALNLTVPLVFPVPSAVSKHCARRGASLACKSSTALPNLERAAAFIQLMARAGMIPDEGCAR